MLAVSYLLCLDQSTLFKTRQLALNGAASDIGKLYQFSDVESPSGLAE